jgi:hypothetical protein
MYGTGEMQLGYIPSDISSAPHSGSVLQIRIVQRIQNKSLSRPELNVETLRILELLCILI